MIRQRGIGRCRRTSPGEAPEGLDHARLTSPHPLRRGKVLALATLVALSVAEAGVALAKAKRRAPTQPRVAAAAEWPSLQRGVPPNHGLSHVHWPPVAPGASLTRAASSPGEPPRPAGDRSLPAGNIPGWRQIFLDDFTVNAPLGSWGTGQPDKVVYTGDH